MLKQVGTIVEKGLNRFLVPSHMRLMLTLRLTFHSLRSFNMKNRSFSTGSTSADEAACFSSNHAQLGLWHYTGHQGTGFMSILVCNTPGQAHDIPEKPWQIIDMISTSGQ